MLKDVAYGVDLVWGKIMPTTIANCYEKCSGKDVKIDETKFIPYP
jgi:beta-N-acetylglucosaminidase